MRNTNALHRFARAVERLADFKRNGCKYRVRAKKGGRVTVTYVTIDSPHDEKVVMDVPVGVVRHHADWLYSRLKMHGGGPIWGKPDRRIPTPTAALLGQRRRLRIKPNKPSGRNNLRNRTIRKLLAIQAAAAGGR